jgi:hypothetical protein
MVKTVFCDLDGTLVKQPRDITLLASPEFELELLPGVKEFLHNIDSKRHHLVITTGRKESLRSATIKQLERVGIWYDQLIMGFGGSERVIINNTKWDSLEPTAHAVTVPINEGLLDHDFLESFL